MVTAGTHRFEADHVVVAMASYQEPHVPPFAGDLDPAIRQLHSAEYRSPDQLREGPVPLVGAGNSGSEIAMEVASRHPVWMSGRDVGQIPFRIDGLPGRLGLVRLVLRVLFHRVLTVKTPIGRKVRPEVLRKGGPLTRVKSKDLARAGVERMPRVVRVEGGLPVLEDGRVLDPANVVWCTGFHPGFDWIDLPVAGGKPEHRSGIVEGEPGLFFCRSPLPTRSFVARDSRGGPGRRANRVRHRRSRGGAPVGVHRTVGDDPRLTRRGPTRPTFLQATPTSGPRSGRHGWHAPPARGSRAQLPTP